MAVKEILKKANKLAATIAKKAIELREYESWQTKKGKEPAKGKTVKLKATKPKAEKSKVASGWEGSAQEVDAVWAQTKCPASGTQSVNPLIEPLIFIMFCIF